MEWNKESSVQQSGGQKLLGDEQGAVKGFSMGVSYCFNEEYGSQATHDDQEGFYVVSGAGYLLLGDTEYRLEPGMSLIAKADEPHAMRKTSREPIKVVWAHGAT